MNKVVLITGSSRDMGKAEAFEFAQNGYDVIINYVNSESKAEEVKNEIEKMYNVKILKIKANLANENDIKNLVTKAYDEFGHIDVLVNNAGIAPYTPMAEKTISSFENTMMINFYAPVLLTNLIAPKMMEQKYGKIVNISTIDVMKSYNANSAEYDASKAALINFTKTSALAYQPYVNVNCVCPGWIHTDMTAQNGEELNDFFLSKICKHRFGKPEEIAKLVYFLASDDADFIDGETICADGGFKNI